MVKLRFTPDEIARMGDELFDRVVAPRTSAEDARLFVAIDVESGAFEIASDELSAAHRLLDHNPDAQLWLRRVGSPYLYHFSPRFRPHRGRPV